MAAGDYIRNEAGGWLIRNGDFVVDDSSRKHAEDVLRAKPGQIRQWPMLGADVESQLNGPNPDAWMREAKKQLEADGMRVEDLYYLNGELVLHGSY